MSMKKIVFCILILAFCLPVFAQETSKEFEALFVAKKAFEDGFYDVSLELLERFLKNYPDSKESAEANLLVGQCYFQQNRFLDALQQFAKLADNPKAKDFQDAIYYWTAEVHFRGNNFSKAREYYKKVVDNFPDSSFTPASLYSLGWCLFQEQYYTKAMEYFRQVEEKYAKESYGQDAGFKIIECLYNLKDYSVLKENAKKYIKAYAKDPLRSAYLYFYLAEADYYLNNFDEAVNEYGRCQEMAGDEKLKALAGLGQAWSYFKAKQNSQAEAAFAKVKFENLEKSNQGALLLGRAGLLAENRSYLQAKNIYQQVALTADDPAVIVQGYLGQADACYNLADYKEAVKIYQEALTKLSASLPQEILDKIYYGLAWAYLKEGEFKNAIEEFRKVAKQSEDKTFKVSALCQIGDAYQDSGDFNKALEVYDNILKNYPDSFYSDYVQYQVGLTMLKVSNYEGAIMAFKALKNNFVDSKLKDDATYALGLAYFQREDYDASREVFEKFLEEYKDSSLRAQVMYLLGTSFFNLKKYDQAIVVFKDVLRSFGQDLELAQKAEYEIADCFYQMGNEKEAMARFKALRAKYPDSKLSPEVIWWLGEYYYRHNSLDLSRRYFFSLIQDYPRSSLVADAYYALGISFAQENKYDEAVDNLKKAVQAGRSDLSATAVVAMADIYLKQDKLDEALSSYKEVLADYPHLSNLIFPKMAEVYFKLKDYSQALSCLTTALESAPVRQMPNIQFRIAEIKETQGNVDSAIDDYLKVPYLYGQDDGLGLKALLRVAAIYEDKENFKEAVNIYKKISALDVPEAKYAQERIDWIRNHVK